MTNDKMIPSSGGSTGISPREEVEQMLTVFRSADGHTPTYEEYEAVYTRLRGVCDAETANMAALTVFQADDAENLPEGLTREDIVACAVQARGNETETLQSFEELCERVAKENIEFSGYTPEERAMGLHLTDLANGRLRPTDFLEDDEEDVLDDIGGDDDEEVA